MTELKGLAPKTEKLLRKISKTEILKEFVFVGGSALSIRLQHRLSEDIDLFTWNKSVDKSEVLGTLKTLEIPFTILSAGETQINIVADDVKLTFFAQGEEFLKEREHIMENLYSVPLKTLAGMKVNTLFLRAKFRDYYDLYILNKEKFLIQELFEAGKSIMPELTMKLFQTSLVYTKDIAEDSIHHLSPRYKISIVRIAKHFQKEIEKWFAEN